MNIHTFKDAANSRRNALSNELDDDFDDDDHEVTTRDKRREVDGEEETGAEAFNEIGEAIEPFNMKNEREGGHIDENMNYVFKKERGEVDAWVAGMDETAMEKSIGEAAMAMQKKIARQEIEDAKEAARVRKTTLQQRKEILQHMQPGETLARCMKRLSGDDVKSRGNTAFKRKTLLANKALVGNTDSSVAAAPSLNAEEAKQQAKRNREIVHSLTENADELLAAGLSGIYEMTFEALEASTLLWEYKGLDEVVYGPYTAQQIAQWKSQGYLTGATAVLIRKCGEVQPVVGSINSTVASNSGNSNNDSAAAAAAGKKRGGGIYDDDDLEEPAAKKSKVTFDQSVVTSASSAGASSASVLAVTASAPAEFVKGEWVSSDDIDFGVFVDLDEYDRQQLGRKSSNSSGSGNGNRSNNNNRANSDQNNRNDGGRRGGANSGGRVRHQQHHQRSGQEFKRSDGDDDYDDDGEDQEEEEEVEADPWASKGRRGRNRVNKEADGSDEDD